VRLYCNRIWEWSIIMTVWWVGHMYDLYFIWLRWNIHCCLKNWGSVTTIEIINIICHISTKKWHEILSCAHTIKSYCITKTTCARVLYPFWLHKLHVISRLLQMMKGSSVPNMMIYIQQGVMYNVLCPIMCNV
jgi:hypothetical protein